MTSLPSTPKDAAAPTVERRSAHVQTILTELTPRAITELSGMTPSSRFLTQ